MRAKRPRTGRFAANLARLIHSIEKRNCRSLVSAFFFSIIKTGVPTRFDQRGIQAIVCVPVNGGENLWINDRIVFSMQQQGRFPNLPDRVNRGVIFVKL
jgi:hypothetical protein